MSKSLGRVRSALADAKIKAVILKMRSETLTSVQTGEAAGCHLDQIAKSIIFRRQDGGRAMLFLTAGRNQIDANKA